MKPPKTYASPGAFKAAFDRRFRDDPRARIIIMERFAARVCHEMDGAVIKGGLGLELRLETPRATKDADIIISGSADLEACLTRAGQIDFGDFLKFAVKPARGGDFEVPGMAYPGKRYEVQAFFAHGRPPWPGKPYRRFAVEFDIRGPVEYDEISTSDTGFPHVHTVPIRIYSIHAQIAEKIHAYTDPRHRNTENEHVMRPRDLLDLCRCATSTRVHLDAQRLRASITTVYATRKAAFPDLHDIPERMPAMPPSWSDAFEKQVSQSQLPWQDPIIAHQLASQFIDPVLAGTARGRWDPKTRRWQPAERG